MRILTITSTRPELIRLSIIIKKLDKLVDHILVYTNQNYDPNLSTIFFDELNIRKPNYYFNFEYKTFGEFLSKSIIEFENILLKEKPDKILILGDTNSGLLSIIAEKYKISIYHMEAGNRSYDNRLPEETNRRIIDNVSTYNLPYTEDSKQILLNEGFNRNNIFKTGNPIYEVLNYYENEINNSKILTKLNLVKYKNIIPYILVTTHRTENVDNEEIFNNIINSINTISETYKVVFSIHPRTKDKINKFSIKLNDNIIISEPFGFFDFVKLEKNAKCIISDSGTVQEESCILGVPAVTIRETTERRETIECGSNILSGTRYNNIIESFNIMIKKDSTWIAPNDYLIENVSNIVINILSGKK
jgi:UDP-N-acetylglucosamine 2-epimerase (non-hydrolysing)